MSVVKPDYSGGSLLNLSSSICDFLGVKNQHPRLRSIDGVQGRRILLLLIDGLGYVHLKRYCSNCEEAKWLGNVEELTSVFPSVTSTVLTTLSMGVPPGVHGVLGTVMYVKEAGSLVNTLTMGLMPDGRRGELRDIGYDPRVIFYGGSTIFEEAKLNGYNSLVITPKGISGGLSDLIYRGTEVKEYVSVYDALVLASRALENNTLVYVYIPTLDSIQHEYGPESEEYRVALIELLNTLGRLIRHLPQSTTVVLTADHGQVQVGQGDVVNLRVMTRLLDSLSVAPYGEPRALQLKLSDKSLKNEVKDALSSMGRKLLIYDSSEVKELLGGVTEYTEQRMGDLWVIPLDTTALIYLYRLNDDKVAKFKGHHAGLLDYEMKVPLSIINL
ncbi:alkaline phosphatase family protein [Caldivirga maquilingensis]|uniref:Type I phosphodiesterase/nucleotide pyrophosphatase n=1 Tax=Caldivirga maquilingensis (strain ATCC 700844 / DSM 13496 / JCM 10307 / IC-167) TaxID=397948 RepID=A8MAQ9_CALMQ|nr:alkaline phosphatase family protein [Caldivirga maquilingensis]ABW01095.1 type I phosphodiesterase/nucleotide pyrophosphatase [Caldivirga maquilingensis IC-167]